MGGCTIDLTHEYDVPWEKVVVSYIHRMENEADGEVVRSDKKVCRAEPTHATSLPPPVAAPSIEEDPSIEESDPGDSPSSGEEDEEHGRGEIEVGDRVRLSAFGERSHQDGCLKPGGIGVVLAAGQLAAHHRSWDKTVSKLRVQALGGNNRVYWYPSSSLQAEFGATPAIQAARPSRTARCLSGLVAAAVPLAPSGAAAAATEPVPVPLTATWGYGIDFAVPWVLRKLFALDTLQLSTTEKLDMEERILENTMVNVSHIMGVKIDEWTKMEPNLETGGCTWTRKLNVEYPDWLPEWSIKMIKKAYTEESTGARAKDEQLFSRKDCVDRMLKYEESHAFYQELGLANGSDLVYA